MIDPSFTCGLEPSDDRYPEIAGWRDQATVLAQTTARMRPQSLEAGIHSGSGLPCLFEKGRAELQNTILVVHPLWRSDGEAGVELAGGEGVRFINTFELERRPLQALEGARGFDN